MDTIIRRIWWIVIPTALAVLAFQLYWLRMSYVSQETSLRQIASDALQKAHDVTLVESVKMLAPGEKQDSNRQFRVSSSVSINRGDSGMLDSLLAKSKTLPGIKIISQESRHKGRDTLIEREIKPESSGLNVTKLMANVFSLSSLVEIDTALLAVNYRKELQNRHITLPFNISFAPADQHIGFVTLPVIWQQKDVLLVVHFEGINNLLLFKILWPVVLSFFLVLLIIGCIWTLWRIIVRQKKLEVMKNDFISNITHELKTPVAILRATNEALLSFGGMNDAEKTERYLRLGQDEIRKLQGLVDNIMALTRLEDGDDELTGAGEDISLSALLKAVTQRFLGLPGVDIQLDIQISHDQLHSYPVALKTIFSNLLDNAIKYTIAEEKQISLQVRENELHYLIFIEDQGIGIAKQHLPYIFDRFYRVPHGDLHEVKGHGLGLSHVKKLVERLKGTISVESTPGKGTIFIIQLRKS
ncbi:GHKL domain-containing protein [Chitinophaga polysaccharea]|uniref:sensor histidine kinase n=1 Tax=Chitinophaga TaxID=79328 RepID=UPI00145535DA|nr:MULTISPECIES: HAMP domain-containing sensor histidine kinase [Chitinophaga]NLR57715.1 GHKL domain-containing protein [Chitinophaga polysaccharea]NLU93307.1 GHKL domain-containing protein [Chitinophaga sp. Ak27]